MNIDVHATQQADGSALVKIECDGQEATIVFTGQEVFFVVPEPVQGAT